MAEHIGNSDEPLPSPVDRWEELLESVKSDVGHIAGDVNRIKQVVVAAWWLWWVILTICLVAYILG